MKDLTRIAYNGRIYIPCEEAEAIIGEEIRTCETIYGVRCVSETDYNAILQSNPEFLQKNGLHIEYTTMQTLRAEANLAKSMLPLKKMFFNQIDELAEYQKDINKAIKRLQIKPDNLRYYKNDLAILHNKEFIDINRLHKIGLDLQYLTEISDKGVPGLCVFVVGKGYFYHLYLDETLSEDWSCLESVEGGIRIQKENNRYEWEDTIIKPYDTDRDFRQYNVFENLIWCLQNCEMLNEWQDELCAHRDGIDFHVNMQLLTQLFNEKSFKDYMFFEGIFDFEQKNI